MRHLCRSSAVLAVLASLALGTTPIEAGVPAPKPVPPVPHRDVLGGAAPKALAVARAIDDVLRAKGLPTATASEAYDAPELRCRNLWVPVAPKGYSCELRYRIGAAGAYASVSLRDEPGTKLAETLFGALVAAGATFHDDPAHGAFMTLKQVTSARDALHFDDYSNYRPPPKPDVTVTGAPARAVLGALDAAGIDDTDGTLLLLCNRFGARPACGYQLHHAPGPGLGAATSERLWSAVLAAAAASGFRPPWQGELAETTVINVSGFTFDGTTLALSLVAGNAKPPKPPRPH